MTRLYGRALGGERCVDTAPHGHWKTSTFIAGLRYNQMTAPMLFDAPMNSACFLAYIEHTLCPTLKAGDIVICDNLSSHHAKGVALLIEKHGASIEYLPAYSPDLNPIEMAFSKLKAYLKKQAVDTLEKITTATAQALDTFTPTHCSNFFKHANYASTLY